MARPEETLRELIREINGHLIPSPVHSEAVPELPVVLVVGPPRSGTTLIMQWLASTGAFGYATNFISRFHSAPHVGHAIQRLLADESLACSAETLVEEQSAWVSNFSSRYGKTRGILEPHGFWDFWRQFMPLAESSMLAATERSKVDAAAMRGALAAFERAWGRPILAKGLLVQFELDLILQALPTAFIVRVRRDPVATAASLLQARMDLHGDPAVWYSVRPPGWEDVLGESPALQVAWQVLATHRALDRVLDQVPGRYFDVTYEGFCADTTSLWDGLAAGLARQGFAVGTPRPLPPNFLPRGGGRTSAPDGEPWTDIVGRAALALGLKVDVHGGGE